MELLKVKTARFGEVIKQSGIPHVVTLWQDPMKDKSFKQAVQEQRVMTVHQTTVGTKKDFAEVGFLQGPNLTHLVFPESLKAYAGRRVIGIDYDMLAEESSSSGPLEQERGERTNPTAKQTTAKKLQPGQDSTRTDPQPEQSEALPKRKRKVAATTDALQRPLPSMSPATPLSDRFMIAALKEARKSLQEGGIPIGSALVRHGELLAVGHNKRVQEDDPVTHAETDCLRNGGRLGSYRGCTLYSTLMPCFFCAGAAVQFGIKRVIVGESRNFAGAPDFMREHGIEVVNLDLPECYEMMGKWIRQHPKLWNEDIGRP